MKVSVSITTYNQEEFIQQCIESVLAQQGPFELQVVVGDDCSTDGTARIVNELARAYAGIIDVVRPPRNLGQNGTPMFLETLKHCTGAYIAMLDGDDYWTAEDKLRRQVEFLEEHRECSLCYHPITNIYEDGRTEPYELEPAPASDMLDLRSVLPWHYIGSPTPMVRAELVAKLPHWVSRSPFGDWPIYLLAADRGLLGRLPEQMAAYRIHPAGVWTQAGEIGRAQQVVDMLAVVNGGLLHRRQGAILEALTFHLVRLAKAYAAAGCLVNISGEPIHAPTRSDGSLHSAEALATTMAFLNNLGGDLRAKNAVSLQRCRSFGLFLMAQRNQVDGRFRKAAALALRSLQAHPATFADLSFRGRHALLSQPQR